MKGRSMKITLCSEWSRLRIVGLLRGFSLVLLSSLVAGCPAEKQTRQPAADVKKIVIRGSNTIGEELAPRLIAKYRMEHPDITFDLETKATGYGLAALAVGQCHIAAASRPANAVELKLAQKRGVELNDYVIGSYSVAVIVNPANPIGNLTRDQVRDIFTGTIQNWKEVGGPDAPIHLYVRDPISGTYLGFLELAMDRKPYPTDLKTFTAYAAINEAVAQDPNGIGYSSIELANRNGVKGVSIDGVPPTVATVNKGEYPYVRTLRFYTDKAKEPPAARDFIQFVLSPRGQAILDQMGNVPHP
jgi:phosphate transport system substrate-binding protein